jgi:acetyl esterase/lipase
MVVNHSIDPLDRVPISRDALDGCVHEGERHWAIGPRAIRSVDGSDASGWLRDLRGSGGGRFAWMVVPTGRRWRRSGNLYLHGGAYVVGSARAYQHFVGQVAARAKVAAFVPEYGLAPEHPFPAAADETLAADRGLVKKAIKCLGTPLSAGVLLRKAAAAASCLR